LRHAAKRGPARRIRSTEDSVIGRVAHAWSERRLRAGLCWPPERRVRDPCPPAATTPHWVSGNGKNGLEPPLRSAGRCQPTALSPPGGWGTGCTCRGIGWWQPRQPCAVGGFQAGMAEVACAASRPCCWTWTAPCNTRPPGAGSTWSTRVTGLTTGPRRPAPAWPPTSSTRRSRSTTSVPATTPTPVAATRACSTGSRSGLDGLKRLTGTNPEGVQLLRRPPAPHQRLPRPGRIPVHGRAATLST
jgi:hypothetical protein